MKGILVVIVVLIVAFFAVPMISEGTTNTCQALEKQSVSQTASNIAGSNTGIVHNVINSVGQAGATGSVASSEEASKHPDVGTPVSCTAVWWQQLI